MACSCCFCCVRERASHLLEVDELLDSGGRGSLATVADGGVGEGELAEVVAHHLGLDLDQVVAEAVVDTDLGAEHLGEDDRVAEVGLDDAGLLLAGGGSLGLGEALAEVLVDRVALEAAAGTGVDHADELLLGEVDHLLGLDTAEEVLTERLLGLRL